MKTRPLGNRLLIQVVGEENKSASGIIIPSSAFKRDLPHIAIICEVGPGVGDSLKIGDTIIFEKFSGEPIKVDGEEYSIIESRDVLAVIERTGDKNANVG